MPRGSEIDEVAAAVADRLGRGSSSSSSSRLSERRLSSAIAYRLSGGRGRGGLESGRSTESRIASAVAYRLRVRPTSPRIARLAGGRLSSGRNVTRVASVIADRLAQQREVRPHARFSVDAVSSAIARRLRYSDATGTFPVAAVASAIAQRMRIPGGLRGSASLASSIVARLTRRVNPGGGLRLNEEQDPRRTGGQ
jgi:hypothetical protein